MCQIHLKRDTCLWALITPQVSYGAISVPLSGALFPRTLLALISLLSHTVGSPLPNLGISITFVATCIIHAFFSSSMEKKNF